MLDVSSTCPRRFRKLRTWIAGVLALAALSAGSGLADAENCANPKSAAFQFAFTDPADEQARHTLAQDTSSVVNVTSPVSFDVNTSTTFTTTVGRITFRVPLSDKATVPGTLEIDTGAVRGQIGGFESLVLGFGPLQDDGTTTCAARVVVTDSAPNAVRPDASFTANTIDVGDFGKDDGLTAYLARVPVTAADPVEYQVRLKGRFIPGAKYELFVGAVFVAGSVPFPNVSADLVARFDGTSPPDGPVEVVVDEVKMQPSVSRSDCPLTSLEHLRLAIRAEQVIKLRIDRREKELGAAIDAVGNSGSNPGPAIRALDQLVASVRNEVRAELRDTVRSGIEFSKRHLACAKAQLPLSGLSEGLQAAAATEIDQAIADDDSALVASQTENGSIASEAIRLQGTLAATSRGLQLALFNKEQAGQAFDPGFTLPAFDVDSPEASLAAFQASIAALADEALDILAAQDEVLESNDLRAAAAAILAVQQSDCVKEFFDGVEQAYVEYHTAVREKLAAIKEAADEAAQSPEPIPGAPTPAEGRQAENGMKKIDKKFESVRVSIDRDETRVRTAMTTPPDAAQRFARRVAALIRLRDAAIRADDKAWLREINRTFRRLTEIGE